MFADDLHLRPNDRQWAPNGITPPPRSSRPFSAWLIPTAYQRDALFEIISDLSTQYGSPCFQPHLTIGCGSLARPEQLGKIAEEACDSISPLTLPVKGIEHSSFYYKCVYLALESNPELALCFRKLAALPDTPLDFELQPHISLIYREISLEVRQKLVDQIKLDFETVVFDGIQFVLQVAGKTGDADVTSWNYGKLYPLRLTF